MIIIIDVDDDNDDDYSDNDTTTNTSINSTIRIIKCLNLCWFTLSIQFLAVGVLFGCSP